MVHIKGIMDHVKVAMGHVKFFLKKRKATNPFFPVNCLLVLCSARCFKTKIVQERTRPNRSFFMAFSVVAQTFQSFSFS